MKNAGIWSATLISFVSTWMPVPASAQIYPERMIRYIVPFPPGGGQDLIARGIAPRLAGKLGQQVVVDNRPGGGATLGAGIAAKSAPDGYTIFMGSNTTHAINPNLYQSLSYDAIRDFSAVSQIAVLPTILVVHPSLPVRSVQDLTVLARSRPGELNFGSAGNGTPAQLAGVMFNRAANISVIHVPYKGSNPALTALISGETHMMFGSMTSSLSHVRNKRLRALGVTSLARSPSAPEVRTIAEQGYPGFETVAWYGLVVPAGTAAAIVQKLNKELVEIIAEPEFRTWMIARGAEPVSSTPEGFDKHIKSELAKYAKVVRDAGLRPD